MRPDNDLHCCKSGYRTVQNCIRVSVLDLDDTIFSAGRRMGGRGSNHVIRSLLDQNPPAPNRDEPLTRGHQQCRYCISLYDVKVIEYPRIFNLSDWTVKNCAQCLTVQSSVVWSALVDCCAINCRLVPPIRFANWLWWSLAGSNR